MQKAGWLDGKFPWCWSPELSITTPAQSPVSSAYVVMTSFDIKAVSLQGNTVEALMLPEKNRLAEMFRKGESSGHTKPSHAHTIHATKFLLLYRAMWTTVCRKNYHVTGYISYIHFDLRFFIFVAAQRAWICEIDANIVPWDIVIPVEVQIYTLCLIRLLLHSQRNIRRRSSIVS